MLISVIIPTFEPGEYIYTCLESLKRQTLSHQLYEVIVVLNGCNQPFYEAVQNYLSVQFDNIASTLLQTYKKGASVARNIGLDHARGKYICFIDDDDFVSDNYLYELSQKINPHAITVSDVRTFKNETDPTYGIDYIGKDFRRIDSEKTDPYTCRTFLSSSCCKLIPVTLIDHTKFDIDLNIHEDELFMFEISKHIKHILRCKEAVYYRRLRPNSLSRKKRGFINRFTLLSTVCLKTSVIYFSHPFQYDSRIYLSKIITFIRLLFK